MSKIKNKLIVLLLMSRMCMAMNFDEEIALCVDQDKKHQRRFFADGYLAQNIINPSYSENVVLEKLFEDQLPKRADFQEIEVMNTGQVVLPSTINVPNFPFFEKYVLSLKKSQLLNRDFNKKFNKKSKLINFWANKSITMSCDGQSQYINMLWSLENALKSELFPLNFKIILLCSPESDKTDKWEIIHAKWLSFFLEQVLLLPRKYDKIFA